MRAALAATLGERAALVVAEDMSAVAAVRLASHDSGFVLLVIDAQVAAIDRAMLIAAVGPLAIELAPQTRLVALDLAAGAGVADIVAAADYLVAATSTTGQVLRITPVG